MYPYLDNKRIKFSYVFLTNYQKNKSKINSAKLYNFASSTEIQQIKKKKSSVQMLYAMHCSRMSNIFFLLSYRFFNFFQPKSNIATFQSKFEAIRVSNENNNEEKT